MGNETETKIVHRNNKSRKGKYAQIRATIHGKRITRLLKIRNKKELKEAQNYFKRRYIKGEQITYKTHKRQKQLQKMGIILPKEKAKELKQVRERIRHIRKRGTIEKAFKPGITRTKTRNLHRATTTEISKTTRRILRKSVRDDDLLSIIQEEENMKKIAYRLETKITLKNDKGQELAELETIGKTPLQIRNDITATLRQYNGRMTYQTAKDLETLNYRVVRKIDGELVTASTATITFRKAR